MIFLCLLLLSAAAAGGYIIYEGQGVKDTDDAALTLYLGGDYESAKLLYGENERPEAMLYCDYARAKSLLSQGEYYEAKKLFEALGDFELSRYMVSECDYQKAKALFNQRSYAAAMDELGYIPEHPGAMAMLEAARERLYSQAMDASLACRMDEAIVHWNSLGDYKDSEAQLKHCSKRLAMMAAGFEEPINYAPYAGRKLEEGTLFWHSMGLIYVPDECNEDTRAMMFFPGGFDTALANPYYQDYIYSSAPNAIVLYLYTNGFYNTQQHLDDAIRVLEQACIENNVYLHGLVVCGASNGAYPAVQSVAYYYENYGIAAEYVMTFDCGQHWEHTDHSPTPKGFDIAAEAGTKFLLFEGEGVGMNKYIIHSLVRHGSEVTIVLCRNDGHYGIIYDAIYKGMIDWALGEGRMPKDLNYTYIPLTLDSTYPD